MNKVKQIRQNQSKPNTCISLTKIIGNENEITDVSNTITSNVNNLNIIVNENSARIIKNENYVQNLNHTLNDLSLNTTSSLNFERLELAENNIMLLNNTFDDLSNNVNDFKNDIKTNTANIQSNEGKVSSNQAEISNFKTSVGDLEGIFLCWQKNPICIGNFSYFPFAKIKDQKSPNLTKKTHIFLFSHQTGKNVTVFANKTIRELSLSQDIFFGNIKNTLIKDDIEDNKEEIIILKTNVANNKEDIGENDAKIGSLSDKVASFKTVLDSNTDDINALEDDVFQNAKDIGRNDEDIANLEKIVSNNTKGSSMSSLNNLFTGQIYWYSLFRKFLPIKYASTLQGQNKFY